MPRNQKPSPHFHACTVVRRMLIKTGAIDLKTGQTNMTGEQWETRACGAPLFSEAERETGICKSCAAGWTHPHNYRV